MIYFFLSILITFKKRTLTALPLLFTDCSTFVLFSLLPVAFSYLSFHFFLSFFSNVSFLSFVLCSCSTFLPSFSSFPLTLIGTLSVTFWPFPTCLNFIFHMSYFPTPLLRFTIIPPSFLSLLNFRTPFHPFYFHSFLIPFVSYFRIPFPSVLFSFHHLSFLSYFRTPSLLFYFHSVFFPLSTPFILSPFPSFLLLLCFLSVLSSFLFVLTTLCFPYSSVLCFSYFIFLYPALHFSEK